MSASLNRAPSAAPRVAFFTDSFHEVNGVAHTSRHFDAFARRRALPFLNIHAGPKDALIKDGPVWTLELKRGACGIALEHDMSFDLLFLRRRREIAETLKEFGADLIHITGPSDIGILGAILSRQMRLPLIASWHTNIHEFGARRLAKMLSFLPGKVVDKAARFAEVQVILALSLQFYKLAEVVLAPNVELIDLLHKHTGRPAFLMQRGVDTVRFSPENRRRTDRRLTVGFVGRLSPEKSVRVLRDVEEALIRAGVEDFRILVVGEGPERGWLETNLKHVECTGILYGAELARAYANMDIFAFPSHTDTFGNVVLESLASGVPVVATASGGPKYLIVEGVSGFVTSDTAAFTERVVEMARDPEMLGRMRVRARDFAQCRYWNHVFDQVYDAYEYCLRSSTAITAVQRSSGTERRTFA